MWDLFTVRQLPHFVSVEGFWVALTRGIAKNWPDLGWWPDWYGGLPLINVYVPLLHLLSGAAARIFHLHPGIAYHAVVAVGYVLGPVGVYLLARALGGARLQALLSGLLYSLISPSIFLFSDFRADVGGWLHPQRLRVLTVWGEGPHVSSIVLACAALSAFAWTAQQPLRRRIACAAPVIALLYLTNIPGTIGFVLALFCLVVSDESAQWRALSLTAALAALLAYALAMPGVPPSTLLGVLANSAAMHTGFGSSIATRLWLALWLGGVALLGWALRRLKLGRAARFGAMYAALLLVVVATADSNRFELIPQGGRFHLEMELGFCLFIGCLLGALVYRTPTWVKPLWLVAFGYAAWAQAGNYRAYARLIVLDTDLSSRSEHQSAAWLAAHAPAARVYATGGTGFWLNSYVDNPQFSGCCDQNVASQFPGHVGFLVNAAGTKMEAERAILWLRAYGTQILITSGAESTDPYKSFHDHGLYRELVPQVHEELDNRIYQLSDRLDAHAHTLPAGAIIATPPTGVDDTGAARRFVAMLTPDRAVPIESKSPSHLTMTARDVKPGDAIATHVACHPGWRAAIEGRPVPVRCDGLRQTLIDPGRAGSYKIDLDWEPPGEYYVTRCVALLAMLVLGLLAYPPKTSSTAKRWKCLKHSRSVQTGRRFRRSPAMSFRRWGCRAGFVRARRALLVRPDKALR